MLKLIDSPRLIIEIQKLPEFELIDPEERTANERFNISAEQISLPIHIVEHLQWISYILQKKEISMLILLDEYFKNSVISIDPKCLPIIIGDIKTSV